MNVNFNLFIVRIGDLQRRIFKQNGIYFAKEVCYYMTRTLFFRV